MAIPRWTCSKLTITHGSSPGTILLALSDEIDGTLEVDAGQAVQEEALVNGAHPFVAARGNVSHRVSFTRVRQYDSHAEAQAAVFSESLDIPLIRDDLTIAVDGGNVLELADAIIRTWPARLREATRVARTFTISGGELTDLGPPAS